jgi:putative transposase
MKYNPEIPGRRSLRLKDYDYTQPGAYFVTIVAWGRECLFGRVVDGEMRLSAAGRIVEAEWRRLGRQFPNTRLDAFVLMPNHVHAIIIIHENAAVGATRSTQTDPSSRTEGSPTRHNQTDLSSRTEGSPDNVGATRHTQTEGSPANVGATRHYQTDPLSTTEGSPDNVGATRHKQTEGSPAGRPKGPGAGSLGAVIGQFKSRATRRIWSLAEYERVPIWQRNYYEHIIRSEAEWKRIYEYIENNPVRWEEDQLHHKAPEKSQKREKPNG